MVAQWLKCCAAELVQGCRFDLGNGGCFSDGGEKLECPCVKISAHVKGAPDHIPMGPTNS